MLLWLVSETLQQPRTYETSWDILIHTNTLYTYQLEQDVFKHHHEVNPHYHVSEAHQTTAVMDALSPGHFEPTLDHN